MIEKYGVMNNNAKLRNILAISAVFLIDAFYLTKHVVFSIGWIIILLFLFVSYDKENHFLFFIMLIPYFLILTLNNNNIRGFFFLIASVKIIRSPKFQIGRKNLILGCIILIIEIINDVFYSNLGSLFNVLSCLTYFILALQFVDFRKIGLYDLKLFFRIGIVSAVCTTIVTSVKTPSSLESLRFGETARDITGAMGLPLMMGVLIAIPIIEYLAFDNKTWLNCFWIIPAFIIGYLTASRNFVLILGSMNLFAGVFFLFSDKSVRKRYLFVFIVLLFVLGLILIPSYIPISRNTIFNMNSRIAGGGTSGRLKIWKDCLSFQFSSIRSFLIGNGIISYPTIGSKYYESIIITAHNIFLDSFMALGIIGMISFWLTTILNSYSYIRKSFSNNCYPAMLMIMIIMTSFMTQGTLISSGDYIYILFGIGFMKIVVNMREEMKV